MTSDRRTIIIVGLLLLCGAVQAGVVATGSDAFWPLNAVAVYRRFPHDYRTVSSEAFVVSPAGERHVVKAGLASQRAVRRFRAAVGRAATEDERRRAAELFFKYLAERAPATAGLTGVRMYRLTWDLRAGKVLRRELQAEYVEP